MAWATKQKLERSTNKFILLMLASYANEEDESYPSVNRLVSDTSMDRKTVLKALEALQELGFIEDTGRRVGRTKSIPVYKIVTSRIEAGPNSPNKRAQKSQQEPIIESIISPEPSVQDEDPIAKFLESAPPKPRETKLDSKVYWDEAVGMLMALGLPEATARSFSGKCLKFTGGSFSEAIRAIEETVEANPIDPIAYITAMLGGRRPTKERKRKEIEDAFAELLVQGERRKAGQATDESHDAGGGGDADSELLQPEPHDEPRDVHQDGDEDAGELSAQRTGKARGPKRGYLSDF